MIDDLFQAGTDQALDDRVARAPPPPKAPEAAADGVGFWSLVRGEASRFGALHRYERRYEGVAARGLAGGFAKGIAGVADILGGWGQVMGAYPEALGMGYLTDEQQAQAHEAREKLRGGIDYSSPAGDIFRARSAELMPDPVTAHWSDQLVGGAAAALGNVGFSLAGSGPLAPLTFGLTEGLAEADKLKALGVDLATRTKAATAYGAVQGATIVAPVVGRTVLETAGLVAAAGPGAFAATNAAEQTILKHAGYGKVAESYDPFDPFGLVAATVFTGGIGVAAHALRVPRAAAAVETKAPPADTGTGGPAATATLVRNADGSYSLPETPGRGQPPLRIAGPKTEAAVRDAVQLTPAEQATSDAFERSAGNLRELDAAIKAEKNPQNRAILVAERERLATEAAVKADPDLVDAARVRQTAAAADASRLSRDGDMVGLNEHVAALERAVDQLSNGERVDVAAELSAARINPEALTAAVARITERDTVNPIDRLASPEEKVAALNRLTDENRPIVQETMRRIDELLGTKSKDNVKLPENIISKARRPSILETRPWHDVEHIRDSYRFKTPLDNIDDLNKITDVHRAMGLGNVKVDTGKLLSPGEWGWRIASFDLRMPNGQMVEHYMPVKELEAAKKAGGHKLFEKWRNVARETMTLAQRTEFKADIDASRALYQAAWDAFLSRSKSTEQDVRASLERLDASGSATATKSSMYSSADGALPYTQGAAAEARIAANPSEPRTATRAPEIDTRSSLSRETRSDFTDPSIPLIATGKPAIAITERGTEIPVRWALVEASDLVTSHGNDLTKNAAYPAELQPRDRGRAASEQQIASIENAIKPQLLGESPKASDGAPIIGQDGVVESGNARTIALRRAYAAGKADHYKAWLEANAGKVGLEAKAVAGMKHPVLVRVSEGGYDRAEFARQANEAAVATMSQTEQAKADAGRMPNLEELVANDDGTINVAQSGPFIRSFMRDVVSPAEQGAMMTAGGELSQQGAKRIRDAVFARAYGDPELVAMMAESTDANVKNVLSGMLRAAPRVAQLADLQAAGAREKGDVTGPLVEAVRKFSQLRADGMTVDTFLSQKAMFGDELKPETEQMLRAISADARAPKRVAETITRLVDTVDALGDPRQSGMFDAPDVTDAIRKSTEQAAHQSRIAEMLADNPGRIVRLPDGEELPLAEAMRKVDDEYASEAMNADLATVAADCFLQAA